MRLWFLRVCGQVSRPTLGCLPIVRPWQGLWLGGSRLFVPFLSPMLPGEMTPCFAASRLRFCVLTSETMEIAAMNRSLLIRYELLTILLSLLACVLLLTSRL